MSLCVTITQEGFSLGNPISYDFEGENMSNTKLDKRPKGKKCAGGWENWCGKIGLPLPIPKTQHEFYQILCTHALTDKETKIVIDCFHSLQKNLFEESIEDVK